MACGAVPVILNAMTLPSRRTLINILLIPALPALLGSGAAWFARLRSPAGAFGDIRTPAVITAYVIIALIGETLLRRRFGRSSSPEMYFLRIFLLTLPLQAARLVLLPPMDAAFAASFGLASTRAAWFGRFWGITSLLCISLFAADMPMRRSGSFLGMGALASLAIAVMMPLDPTEARANLLFRSGTDTALVFSCIALEVISLVSLVGAGLIKSNSRRLILTFGLLIIIAGVELSFFALPVLSALGAVMIPLGIAVFARQIHKIYQWV